MSRRCNSLGFAKELVDRRVICGYFHTHVACQYAARSSCASEPDSSTCVPARQTSSSFGAGSMATCRQVPLDAGTGMNDTRPQRLRPQLSRL
jgi:hypothetical protein